MKYLKLGILVCSLGLFMTSCDNDGPVEEKMEEHGERAEEVGEDIDNAVEKTGDKMEEAADEVEEAFDGDNPKADRFE